MKHRYQVIQKVQKRRNLLSTTLALDFEESIVLLFIMIYF